MMQLEVVITMTEYVTLDAMTRDDILLLKVGLDAREKFKTRQTTRKGKQRGRR